MSRCVHRYCREPPMGEAAARLGDAERAWAALSFDSGMVERQTTGRAPPAPSYMLDDESESCGLCGSAWSFTLRRHHCRACGALCCYYCSLKTAPLEILASPDGPVLVDMAARKAERVCDACFHYLSFSTYMEQQDLRASQTRNSASSSVRGVRVAFLSNPSTLICMLHLVASTN